MFIQNKKKKMSHLGHLFGTAGEEGMKAAF